MQLSWGKFDSSLKVTSLLFAMLSCRGWKLIAKRLLTSAKICILKSPTFFVRVINVVMVLLTLVLLIDYFFSGLILYLPVFVLILLMFAGYFFFAWVSVWSSHALCFPCFWSFHIVTRDWWHVLTRFSKFHSDV